MDKSTVQTSSQSKTRGKQRRAFFAQILAAVGGGVISGGLIERFLRSGRRPIEKKQPMKISVNPLAVSRSKEGSNSNG